MNLEETKNIVSKIFNCSWVKWIHEGTKPTDNNFEKTLNAVIGTILPVHCAKCLNLNGCCFVKEKAPTSPLHERCHCKLIDIGLITPRVTCPIEKFTKYLFDGSKSNGKKDLFESWGYSIIDSETLVQGFIKQAKLKYQCGEYNLGSLDACQPRIIRTSPNAAISAYFRKSSLVVFVYDCVRLCKNLLEISALGYFVLQTAYFICHFW